MESRKIRNCNKKKEKMKGWDEECKKKRDEVKSKLKEYKEDTAERHEYMNIRKEYRILLEFKRSQARDKLLTEIRRDKTGRSFWGVPL